MPDFNQINNNKKDKPFPMNSENKKFPGIREAFQQGGRPMWIYIGIGIVVLGLIIAIIAGVSSSNSKKKQQSANSTATSSYQLSSADKAELDRKTTRKDINKQGFNGAIQAAGLTVNKKTVDKTMKSQGKILADYSMAVGNKKGSAYDSAMEYREFKTAADALAFTMNYCTSAVENIPEIKPDIYYFDNQGGEASASSPDYYFRAYCYGNKVIAMGCSASQAQSMNKIFNSIVRK